MTARPSLDPTPETFSKSGAVNVPDRYWLAFGDPTLDALVEEALIDNPGLLATWARIAQAEATSRGAASTRFPTVSGNASAGGSVRGDSDGVTDSTSTSVGLSASYELDLWGKLEAARDASALAAAASAIDLRSAGISLSAEIVSTWFDIVLARQELALLDAQLADELEVERLIGLRLDVGNVPETDYLRQKQQVEALRGDLELATARRVVLENSLSILLGDSPGTPTPTSGALPSIPPLPKTGIPGEAVNRRPDVQPRLIDIEIADKKVAVAVADRFPSIKLTANLGATGSLYELVANFTASLVAGIAAPIFDGGKREAEVDRSREVVIEKVHLYREIVLSALRDVEDALVRESQQGSYIESLEAQLEIAVAVRTRVESAYAVGIADALDVLSAGESQRSLEKRLLTIVPSLLTESFSNTVSLFIAPSPVVGR